MSEDVVIRYLKERSEERLEAVIAELRDDVHASADRILKDASLAEDVVQEVFHKLHYGTWTVEEIRSGVALVRKLAQEAAIDARRSKLCRERHEAEFQRIQLETPPEEPLAVDDRVILREAVSALPEPVRRCVELRYYNGLDPREIARTLELRRRQVHRQLAAGHKSLRRSLTASQALLILPVLEGRCPPATPDGSGEHLARYRKLEQSVRSQEPSGSGQRRAQRNHRRLRRAHRVPRAAFYGSLLLVVGGVVLIGMFLSERRDVPGVDGVSTAPLAAMGRGDPAQLPAGVAPPSALEAVDPQASLAEARVAEASGEVTPQSREEWLRAGKAFARLFDIGAPFKDGEIEIVVVGEDGELIDEGRLIVNVLVPDARGKEQRTFFFDDPLRKVNPLRTLVTMSSFLNRDAIARLEVDGYPFVEFEFFLEGGGHWEFVLPSSGESVLAVRDAETEKPIRKAEVAVTARPGDGRAVPRIAGRTDPDGILTLRGLATAPYTDLEVKKSGYRLVSLEGTDFPAEKTIWLHRLPEVSCGAKIRTSASLGAHVVAVGRDAVALADTDVRGRSTFEGLPAGRYRFELLGSGLQSTEPAEREWCVGDLTEERYVDKTIHERPRTTPAWHGLPDSVRPEPGTLACRVVDTRDQPVAGIDVLLDGGWRRLETAATGRDTFEELEAEIYSVELAGRTHWMLHRNVNVRAGEETRATFRYGRRQVRGRLSGGGGHSASYQVLLATDDRSSYAQPEDDGSFAFEGVLPGSYRLLVFEPDGSYLPYHRLLTVDSDEDPEPIKVRLGDLVPVWVAVRNVPGGLQKFDKVVAIAADGSRSQLEERPRGTKVREFFGFLPVGDYRLEARAGGVVQAAVEAVVGRGKVVAIEIVVGG